MRKSTILGLAAGILSAGAVIAGTYAHSTAGPSPSNESTLSDSDREALHKQLRAEAIKRDEAFLTSFTQNAKDPRRLDRVFLSEAVRAPRDSTTRAVNDAAIVAVGKVQDQAYRLDSTGFVWTYSTVAIETSSKGNPGNVVVVRQVGGPAFGDHGGVQAPFLLASESNPPIFVGDRRLMFLLEVGKGLYELQAYTGQYALDGTAVRAVSQENPLKSRFDGRTINEVEVEVRELAKR